MAQPNSTAHPEGQRDRPDEAPATACEALARDVVRPPHAGANSGPARSAGEDEEKGLASHDCSCRSAHRSFARVRARLSQLRRRPTRSAPQHACVECLGPLEIGYDADALARVTHDEIEAGPHSLWRYAGLLPVGQDPATRVDSGTGMTPLIRADRLADELGFTAPVWIKDDSANPTHSFKDRVVSVAITAARELGFERIACASTGNLAQLGRRPRRAHRHAVDRVRPVRPGAAEDRPDRDLRRHARRHRGFLRRRQPAVLRAVGDRRVREDRLRERQRPARTTPRVRRRSATRSPSSSAGGCRGSTWRRWRPDRC